MCKIFVGITLLGGPADSVSPVMHLYLATSADVETAEATLQVNNPLIGKHRMTTRVKVTVNFWIAMPFLEHITC